MSVAPSLSARLDGNRIALEPIGDVPPALVNALGRNIAPGDRWSRAGQAVLVPVERFLASRAWLSQALRSYSVNFLPSDVVTALLRRQDEERAEVDRLLSSGLAGADQASLTRELVEAGFRRQLMPFQLDDVSHLLALSHGANFSVPGAGKTTAAYACYAVEKHRGRVSQLLVVAPLSAFDAWVEESAACLEQAPRIGRFDGSARVGVEVLLVNYQRVAAGLDALVEWATSAPTHVILDEAHRMKKGRSGEWGRACLDLAEIAARRDILTGTPAPQHPRDFSALLDFVWPHQANRILPAAVNANDPPPGTMTAVSTRIAPLFVRTTKSQLGLTDPQLRVEQIPMGPVQRDIYDALRLRASRLASGPREQAMFSRMGEITMYLLEAASNPGLLAQAVAGQGPRDVGWPSLDIPAGSSLADRVLEYGQHEVPAKFERLVALVAENADRGAKTLVWSSFVGTLEQLADHVLAPYAPALVHGGVPSTGDHTVQPSREAELHKFRTDPSCMVLLANPAAMSEGVSLHHECHDAVYVDRTFNAGQYLQSLDRIHRLGLPPGIDTTMTFLVCTDTIDEVVDDRVRTKADRLATMLRDPDLVTMALPDDEDYGEWIEVVDLDALLAHLSQN